MGTRLGAWGKIMPVYTGDLWLLKYNLPLAGLALTVAASMPHRLPGRDHARMTLECINPIEVEATAVIDTDGGR